MGSFPWATGIAIRISCAQYSSAPARWSTTAPQSSGTSAQPRFDALQSSLPTAVEEKRRVAFRSTTQSSAVSQRASDQATITQASRSALLPQKRIDAASVLPDASQATDDVLQAAFRIMRERPCSANTTPDEVTRVDTDDEVEVMHQVYGNSNGPIDSTPLFHAASSTHTQA